MTERLYYSDCYLKEFSAEVVERSADGRTLYLDRTAFYPTSGGQPFDIGSIGGAAVLEVADEGDRIAHILAAEGASGTVECRIDWQRRFDHMQQHTGQHLLSAVFEELFSLRTVSFHLGASSATIDLEGGNLDTAGAVKVERRANELIWENRPVRIAYEQSSEAQGLRKASEREGLLRIISIDGLDRSACGGTHLRATGEIGALVIRRMEKVRQTVRVEFLCGGRAVSRARADYQALNGIAQLFSASLDEVPGMVSAQLEAARSGEKARRKLELDVAGYRGKELYDATAPGEDGVRRALRREPKGNLEDLRAIAQSFTARPKAVFVAALEDPPSVLLAVSEDAGIDAGKVVKAAVTEAGGRGGGTARIAQGSVPEVSALERALAAIG